MSKFIIFCADGTWNGPDKDDDHDGVPDPTNVFKIYSGLAGQRRPGFEALENEQEKELAANGATLQVAKYIHGVGDTNNPIRKLWGGTFGTGLVKRIVRGYTFISRNYEPGDAIVVLGFSRGAYTARAVAGLIASQGLLAKPLTADPEQAYRWGAKAWCRYRQQNGNGQDRNLLADASAAIRDLFSKNDLRDRDLVLVDRIKAVAVWDTVGSLGLPTYDHGERVDLYRFADTRLAPKVEHGFHAVALDERRADFTPTLWDDTPNVVQRVFPGSHADVGGGYPPVAATDHRRPGELADVALEWMVENLKSLGIRFAEPIYAGFRPDPAGAAHKPWEHAPFDKLPTVTRVLPEIPWHPSVKQRQQAGPVIGDPREPAAPYRPSHRPA